MLCPTPSRAAGPTSPEQPGMSVDLLNLAISSDFAKGLEEQKIQDLVWRKYRNKKNMDNAIEHKVHE